METIYDVIVVGASAAGLIAAARVAELGGRVLLLEKMELAGRKMLISGKGRCNITNDAPQNEFLKHIHPNSRFLRHAFSNYFSTDILRLLHHYGCPTVVERGGRVFPVSIDLKPALDESKLDQRLTMRSKLIQNLYFAGEVIDLNADTGGYNLQIAFSTAWLAASACMAPSA